MISKQKHPAWVERHRPLTVAEYVFNNDGHKAAFLKVLEDKMPQHLLLEGIQGSGKTTIAKILISELIEDDNDLLIIDASRDNGIDVIRDRIMSFIRTMAMGEFKIILLEEADYISPAAQGALRTIMETYSAHARFILTCNYVNRIIEPIKSRCARFTFGKPAMEDVMYRVAEILVAEDVKFSEKNLTRYVSAYYPDIRAVINQVQSAVRDGRLQAPSEIDNTASDWRFGIQDHLDKGDWASARQLVCSSCAGDDFVGVYRFLYDNLHKFNAFKSRDKYDSAIEIIAEGCYRHSLTSDPEITMAGVLIQLSMV